MSFTYTNELVLQLIRAYKNHELLWDPSNPDFKNRTKKNDAWDDIANSMNIPRREIESKMHTIRSQFAREKKKIAQMRKNGRDDLKYAPWFAYEPLKFLLKGETETDGFDSSDMRYNQNDELSESYQSETVQFGAPIPMLYESTNSTTPIVPTSRKRTHSYDDKSDDTMGFGSAKQFRPSQKSGPDEFEIFAQYVASELRETKDLHSILMAKHYINDILFNARMGKYRKDGSVSFNSERKGIKAELNIYHNSDVNDDE